MPMMSGGQDVLGHRVELAVSNACPAQISDQWVASPNATAQQIERQPSTLVLEVRLVLQAAASRTCTRGPRSVPGGR